MVLSSIHPGNVTDFTPRPKRTRFEPPKHYDSGGSGPKELELCDVINVLRSYVDYGGGVNCSVCDHLENKENLLKGEPSPFSWDDLGKLYKSKVCFIKHIWEHSVYWDLFDGAKNHERVLSIQAALILYSGNNDIDLNGTDSLMNLLVTAPNTPEKKKETDQSPHKNKPKMDKFHKMESSPLKRKRSED